MEGLAPGTPYIKPEAPHLLPTGPPDLVTIPGREAEVQESKQVQAAMMAAIYSQSPWAAIMMAQQRERMQQQLHSTVPHPQAQASAPRPATFPPTLPAMPGLPGAQQILEQSRQQYTKL